MTIEKEIKPVAWMTVGYMDEPLIQRHPPQYALQVTPLYAKEAIEAATQPLRVDIERLADELNQMKDWKDAMRDKMRQLEAELAAAQAWKVDAERYRWLRNDADDSSIGVFEYARENHKRAWVQGSTLDHVVDDAIQELKQ